MFQPGDLVVYRMLKSSTHPGPRAENVTPARYGDTYSYQVDKYWVVSETLGGGRLRIRTRTGKHRVIDENSPCLRRPSLLERLFYRGRFPHA